MTIKIMLGVCAALVLIFTGFLFGYGHGFHDCAADFKEDLNALRAIFKSMKQLHENSENRIDLLSAKQEKMNQLQNDEIKYLQKMIDIFLRYINDERGKTE